MYKNSLYSTVVVRDKRQWWPTTPIALLLPNSLLSPAKLSLAEPPADGDGSSVLPSGAASPGHLVSVVASYFSLISSASFHLASKKSSTCNNCNLLHPKRSHCRPRLQCQIGYTLHAGQVESRLERPFNSDSTLSRRFSRKVCVFVELILHFSCSACAIIYLPARL